MAETYNNVPMSEELAESVAKTDAFWTGPKLVALCAATLIFAMTTLWLAANGFFNGTVLPGYTEYHNVNHDLGPTAP